MPSNVDNQETQNKDKQTKNKKHNTEKMSNTEPTIKQIGSCNSEPLQNVLNLMYRFLKSISPITYENEHVPLVLVTILSFVPFA